MVYIALPDESARRLSFYLAMEEYVARKFDVDDCFFMWQVEPSVIFGRNQLIDTEVNVDFCKAHNIKMYRRKSGGGCVYADMSNVMFSYITKDESVNFTFNKYIGMVVLMLQRLGVDAHATGRNDVMIGGRKVSGNAFYHVPGRSIVHGTMLYDTDMVNMVGSITPSDNKLISKGIQSVRQRIALLKDYLDISLEDFKSFVRNELCNNTIVLDTDSINEIEEIEKEYLTPEFIFGNNPKYSVVKIGRIDGVGDFEVRLEMRHNIIKSLTILGDFFIVGDVDKEIIEKLKNVSLTEESIKNALPEHLEDVIMNLSKDDFVSLLIKSN